MEKENNIILKAEKIVSSSYLEYFEAVKKYSKKEISKSDFKKAKLAIKKHKEEVDDIRVSLDENIYDPALNFALKLSIDEIKEAIKDHLDELKELRKDGEQKCRDLKEEITNIKLRKNLKRKEKKEMILPLLNEFKEAYKVELSKKKEVNALIKQATFILRQYGKVYRNYIKEIASYDKDVASTLYKEKRLKEKLEYKQHIKGLDKKDKKFASVEHNSKINEFNREYNDSVAKAKDLVHDSYLQMYSLRREIRNNKPTPIDKLGLKWENYKHKFTLSGFLVRNSLYIVIIIFFIICAIVAQIQGNPLLTSRTLETIFIQSSTKVFFSLGVAGLILLGGTDLSIGRMTGMAATFSCLIMSGLVYETNIGVIDMTIPQGVAIVLGIFVCIFSTTIFSALAGFFTSKFKIHPFITTLSTQLLIYGIMMVCFSQVPAFTMNSEIKVGIAGENGYKLIGYAILIIIIVWFIWNKTKFGKHMYAVGDNKEAASVSGINVFWVTMGVFIMAGILYGLGGFLEGARIGNANPSTALGTELDAIAACVIGGISFSGGKGKVSGAVVGTVIFATLTYCLTYIGLDINFQFIFKGIIILAAVCLDSLKFLKKK